ncbi:MAG: hypothetical protein ACM3XM_06985 [Mycobacterium leprae]
MRLISWLNPLTYQSDSMRLAYVGDWARALLETGLLLAGAVLLMGAACALLPRADLAGGQRG